MAITANYPCPNVIDGCLLSADDPLSNLSSELPEQPLPPDPEPPPEPPPDPIDPPVVDGFTVWLNTEEGLFQDVDGTTPIVNGTRVALWEDQSGNNNDAEDQGDIQVGFPSWPLYRTDVTFNGYPVLDWNDISKQRLATAGNVDFGTAGLTVFCVAAFLNHINTYGTLFGFNNSDFIFRELNATNRIEVYHNTSGANPVDPSTYSEDVPHVFAFRYSNALNTLVLYVDDVAVASAADAGALGGPGRYAIGGRQDDNVVSFFRGYMAELICYPLALNDAEVSQVNQQLMTKYAI